MRRFLLGTSLVAAVAAILLAVTFAPVSAANKKCPISGKDVNADVTLNVNGEAIAFCCKNCPKAYLKQNNIKDGDGKCPISGKPGKEETQLIHLKTSKVAFCCANCQKKYATKNEIKLVDKGPTKCPVSGGPAKAENKLVVNGEATYFCCDKCPKKFAAGLNIEKKDGEAKCPISGKPGTEETAILVTSGTTVTFCCENCQKKYIKENVAGDAKKKTDV